MFGHPTETKKQVNKTINFILKNNFNIIGVSIATPFPGSKLWDYATKEKIVNKEYIDKFAQGKMGDGYSGIYPVYVPKTLKLDWLYEKRKLIMRKFYFRPKNIINRIKQDIFSLKKMKQNFIEAINLISKGSSSRAPYQKKYNVK